MQILFPFLVWPIWLLRHPAEEGGGRPGTAGEYGDTVLAFLLNLTCREWTMLSCRCGPGTWISCRSSRTLNTWKELKTLYRLIFFRKLSKLVSQLNSTTMPVTMISHSPAVFKQRKDRKVSQGSFTAGSDNDWGSDFEDAPETFKIAEESKVDHQKIYSLHFSYISRFLPVNC